MKPPWRSQCQWNLDGSGGISTFSCRGIGGPSRPTALAPQAEGQSQGYPFQPMASHVWSLRFGYLVADGLLIENINMYLDPGLPSNYYPIGFG